MTRSRSMHTQRTVLVIAAAAGVVSALLPWQTILVISQNGLDLGQAWVVFAVFGAALLVSLLGNWARPLEGPARPAAALLGLGGAGFGVWKLVEVHRGTLGSSAGDPATAPDMLRLAVEPGMGLYVMVAGGAALAVAALWRPRRSTLLGG